MAGTVDFIEDYGNKSFEEKPFCDGDAMSLCLAFYMPFEEILSDSFDETEKFSVASYNLFAKRGFKHTPVGIVLPSSSSKCMMSMADTRRYSDLKVTGVKNIFEQNPATQFCAGSFILPNGNIAVIFRGTDDTVAGWKEDVDIFTHKGTPSHKLALEYIEELKDKYDGDIILCGHSKGGNLAIYTALKCSDEARKRIRGIYNYDGPGFHSYGIFNLSSYDEILPYYKHYVPYGSCIGMIMAHDYDYKAAKNIRHIGVIQHGLENWILDSDGNLETLPDTDKLSKVCDLFFAKLCAKSTDKDIESIDRFLTVITDGIGYKYLTDAIKNPGESIRNLSSAVKNALTSEIKKGTYAAFKGTGKLIAESIKGSAKTNLEHFSELAYSTIN